jgi:hypothetical protein
MADIRFLMAHGSFFTLIDKPEQSYPSISWADIVRMVKDPQAKDKADADLFIPSTYTAHDGRSHDAQRERGSYRMLAIDIDQGNPSKDDVTQAVRDVLGDVSMIIYSSSGANPDRLKWRVLLPLAAPVDGAAYEEIQSAFFDLLRQHGITPDGALARCGQPIYLPNVPMAKRGPDLKPIFYDHAIVRSNNVALTDGNPIMQEVGRRAEQRRLAFEQAEIGRRDREKQRADRRLSNPTEINPVDAFNDVHTISDLLLKYGYERRGSSAHYKSRYQSSGSYATQDFGTHWVSLSGSDASAAIGRSKAMGDNAYCYGDAFDLFAHYEHGGDFKAAVRAYGAEIKLPITAPPPSDIPVGPLDDFDYVQPKVVDQSAEKDYIDIPMGSAEPPTPAAEWPVPYKAKLGADIPPRRWIYGYHYLRAFVSLLASAGGIGKTSLQIVEAICICIGRALLGETVHERCNVWIINLEDPLEEIDRRITAAMDHYGVKQEDIEGKLFVSAGRDFSLKFGTQTRDGVIPNVALVEYMVRKIKEWNIGMIFIDPLVGAHNVNENDNGAVNAIVAEIRRVADEANCGIAIVHHIRKGNGDDAGIDSVRGASSVIGAVRAARVINKISEDDAVKLGIPLDDAKGIFRVDDGKANLAPPASASVYRRMIGVKIGNGEWVGVCTPFTLPDEWEGMDEKTVNRILSLINAGILTEDGVEHYSSRPQDKERFAGSVISAYHFDNAKHTKNDAQAKRIIKHWMTTGLLEEFTYRSSGQYKDRKGLRSTSRVGEQS